MTTEDEFSAIRAGLQALPPADSHAPSKAIVAEDVLAVPGHKAALDPDRDLVVGNRGMGKSFWTHALADPEARRRAAETFSELGGIDVRIGFNASSRAERVAPTTQALREAFEQHRDPDAIWRAVMVRAAADLQPDVNIVPPTGRFSDLVEWVRNNGHVLDRALTVLDDALFSQKKRVVVVFDALDRMGDDWPTTRVLTSALLKLALGVRSFRSLRLKIFMRRDQFDDPDLFGFPDSSKIKNTRVDLKWSSSDLYTLLFARLARSPDGRTAFASLCRETGVDVEQIARPGRLTDRHKDIVDAIAGEYMGADKRRGRVFTWLPLHLSDSRSETSPRTFLTAWREAAHHAPAPAHRAVDHLGLLEGVRHASQARLVELKEDYAWIEDALEPLRGQMVPMPRTELERIWSETRTVERITRRPDKKPHLIPLQLTLDGEATSEAALVDALQVIGVVELRSNDKINVPDIFRVEAGIKRKGGTPPRRGAGGSG